MRKTKSLLRWVIIKAPVTGQKTAFEEINCDVRERDFEPARWSSYLAKRISALTLMTNLLSCGFGSHMNNPAGRCNRASNAEERSE